jgi:hypothetical protein
VPCRKTQLAVVAHRDGAPTQVLDALNHLGLAQVVHLRLAQIVHPRASRRVGIDRIQNVRRRDVNVDRSNRLKRAHRGNRIRREFLSGMSWLSRLGLSGFWLSGLCMNMQRKVTGHGDEPKRRNHDTQPNARRDPWVRTDNHDVITRIKTIK